MNWLRWNVNTTVTTIATANHTPTRDDMSTMKYNYQAWPGKDLAVEVCKSDATTGAIVKVKRLPVKLTKAQWRAKGYSFNGRLNVRCQN